MDECKPLDDGMFDVVAVKKAGRGLHSSTSQLNLSAFYGKGGARRCSPCFREC